MTVQTHTGTAVDYVGTMRNLNSLVSLSGDHKIMTSPNFGFSKTVAGRLIMRTTNTRGWSEQVKGYISSRVIRGFGACVCVQKKGDQTQRSRNSFYDIPKAIGQALCTSNWQKCKQGCACVYHEHTWLAEDCANISSAAW